MTNKTERQIVEELQAKADRQRKQAIEIQLGDPGPYVTPRFVRFDSAMISDQNTVQLFLETAKGQQVRVQIAADQLPGMKLMLDHLISQKAR
ncbi:hypothetical protein [Mesorhizobium australicum]|uniref:Uncharacterized protein n=1 Tax=Mesorhizobium australicum TaxID=536018 RepID=A0A1X7NW61_9HYPH|nr:hypothetical protein [Mesorhizobium australicum]SMH42604.1 hypothetical protein SAMN02982922_2767 [Mesorhizobium australicum]